MNRTEVFRFLGALLIPWRLASLLFIAISAALLALFQNKGVVGIVGSYFLLSWLFKYAFVMLEHVANGRLDAPVVSVEMLGPFEQRPLILVAWCLVLYAAARTLGGAGGVALATVLFVMLPAPVAILGLGSGFLQSLNPLTLWRIIRDLGVYYLGILALILAAVALVFALNGMDAWSILTIAAAEVAVLTIFSAIGGALFGRRLQIGHDPIVSPERQLEKDNLQHIRGLSAMLDDIYNQTRLGKHEVAVARLRQWFAQSDGQRIVSDAHTIQDRVRAWNNADTMALVSQTLVAELNQHGLPEAATSIQRSS